MTTPATFHFLSTIPPGIIYMIGEECETRDVKSLRLACKDLAVLLKIQAVRDVSIHIKRGTLSLDISKLQFLARLPGLSTLTLEARMASLCVNGIRSLTIGSLSPVYSDSFNQDQVLPGLEIMNAEYTIKQLLFEIIVSLQGLKIVKYVILSRLQSPINVPFEDPRNHQIIMRAVKLLPKLRTLSVKITHHHQGLQLSGLTGLKDIEIINISRSEFNKGQNGGFLHTLNNLACMIASDTSAVRTHLRDLTILSKRLPYTKDYLRMMLNEGFWSFHSTLKYYPADEPSLNLSHLSLDGISIRLDNVTTPHLRNLTTLSLTNIVDPAFVSENIGRHDHDYRTRGSSPEQFWKALQQAEIWLQEITLDEMTDSLMDYLSSYSGLRAFAFSNQEFSILSDPAIPDAHAHALFDNGGALSTHIPCLERLKFTPWYLGDWTIKEGNIIQTILKCKKLRELNLPVAFGEREKSFWAKFWTKPLYSQYAVTLLIETAVSMQLDVLTVSIAVHEHLRGSTYGEARMGYTWHTTEWIYDIVKAYEIEGVHRLPALIVSGAVPARFSGVEHPDSKTWRYTHSYYY